MRVFTHTAKERGMWRGWLRNGQSLELYWGRSGVGFRILIHSNDNDDGNRMLSVALGFCQAFIPLGVVPGPYSVGDEPSWGFDLSREFGVNLHWRRRWHFDWPFTETHLLHEFVADSGEWRPAACRGVGEAWHNWRDDARTETHPYAYALCSGETQHVQATVRVERRTWGRKLLHRLGWPKRVVKAIDVEFSDEVGERAGSWKGGTVGCGYTMLPGESAVDTLRRMERERRFN